MQDFEIIDSSLPTEQWEMNIVESLQTDETIEDDSGDID
jgi:hypothetical protein